MVECQPHREVKDMKSKTTVKAIVHQGDVYIQLASLLEALKLQAIIAGPVDGKAILKLANNLGKMRER